MARRRLLRTALCGPMLPCPTCQRCFRSRPGLRLHHSLKNDTDWYFALSTYANQCIWFGFIFRSKHALRDHAQVRREHRHCPLPTHTSTADLVVPLALTCPRRALDFPPWACLAIHLRAVIGCSSCLPDPIQEDGTLGPRPISRDCAATGADNGRRQTVGGSLASAPLAIASLPVSVSAVASHGSFTAPSGSANDELLLRTAELALSTARQL